MAATTYTYSIAADTANAKAAGDALDEEIRKSSIVTALDGVSVAVSAADNIDVTMKDALSAGDKTTLDSVVAAHEGAPLVENSVVTIKEEVIPTGGHFQGKTLDIVTTATIEKTTHDFTFPWPVNLLAAEADPNDNNTGDIVCVHVAPEEVIGTLSADEAAGQDVLSVSQSVLDNTFVGAVIHVDDGTNKDACGHVLEVDKVAGTIKVETALVNAFVAATPSYVKMTTEVVPSAKLRVGSRIEVGFSKVGASYIPAGKIFRIIYDNKTAQAKELEVWIEYLY